MANEGQLKPDVDGNARLGSDCVWLLRSCVELKGEGQMFFMAYIGKICRRAAALRYFCAPGRHAGI